MPPPRRTRGGARSRPVDRIGTRVNGGPSLAPAGREDRHRARLRQRHRDAPPDESGLRDHRHRSEPGHAGPGEAQRAEGLLPKRHGAAADTEGRRHRRGRRGLQLRPHELAPHLQAPPQGDPSARVRLRGPGPRQRHDHPQLPHGLRLGSARETHPRRRPPHPPHHELREARRDLPPHRRDAHADAVLSCRNAEAPPKSRLQADPHRRAGAGSLRGDAHGRLRLRWRKPVR